MRLKIEFSAKVDDDTPRILKDTCAAYLDKTYIPTWIFISYPDEGYFNGKVLLQSYYATDIRKIHQLTKPRNKAERQLTKYLKGILTRRFIEYKPKLNYQQLKYFRNYGTKNTTFSN